MILFLHIPKTGGNSVFRILHDHYGKERVYRSGEYPPRVPRNTCVVAGHFVYGVHEFINEPCEYIAMLREPVDRIISYYAMSVRAGLKDWSGRYAQFWEGGKAMSFIDFALNKINMPGSLDNGTVRQLAGAEWYYDPRPVTEETYRIALANLKTCRIGLTERFEESMARFARHYGWQYETIVHANESFNRPTITIGERRKVERFNKWSVKLYQEAVRLYDEQG
jgi:hypothetical protein